MANNHFLASVYQKDGNALNALFSTPGNVIPATMGISRSFPSAGVDIYPANDNTIANGVTMHSVIELLPTGLNQRPIRFYSDATVATLNTAAT